MTPQSHPPLENPFATRFTRPGALQFIFPPGESATTVVDRLQQSAWRGQILGPHGVGKSTLLHALGPEITRRGRRIVWIALHDRQRLLSSDALSEIPAGSNIQLIVDGYEQLSRWSRWRLARKCKQNRWGLLVTAHRNAGLPTVLELRPQLQVLQQLARQLSSACGWTISHDELADVFQRTGHNMRESLFELYDAYERQNRSSRS